MLELHGGIYEKTRRNMGGIARYNDDALRLGPRKEDLLGLCVESRGDVFQWFVHRASGLVGERAVRKRERSVRNPVGRLE